MDDPALAWPAWKFGMKRDAIHTTLHDQYNTFQFTIQDPDAFQHDVHEIASEAASAAEFHHLLGERRGLRLKELNDSLESASYEIIASPMLIGTKQWEHALQLFRTRSLDSLVRYFSSYLPSDHHWYQPVHPDSIKDAEDFPPSPRSITTYSDDMESSAHDVYSLKSMNTMSSYTDSDSGVDDEPAKDIVINTNENKTDDKTVNKAVNATVENVHDDTKHNEASTDTFDDCSSQSSGPETPDSMSDAEPDVDVTDDDAHHSHHHAQHMSTLTPKAPENTVAAPADSLNNTTPTRRSPLQSDYTVDVSGCSAPMPLPLSRSHAHSLSLAASSTHPVPASAHVRSRQRSMSPSRSSPLAHHHIELAPHEQDTDTARGAGRLTRSRFSAAQQGLPSHCHTRSSRRPPDASIGSGITAGARIEKTPTSLPRTMRFRLRKRREAAAARKD